MRSQKWLRTINKELKKLKLNLKEKNPELLFGSQKVCQEFLKLQLPVYSEILDVGARSGFLSASLQAHGYTNIDTIIENLSALAQLKSLKLHRNMICQGLTGLNSTGLRENTYDVIVTSSHSLNPTNITELLNLETWRSSLLYYVFKYGCSTFRHKSISI